jgi:hypothetical protein
VKKLRAGPSANKTLAFCGEYEISSSVLSAGHAQIAAGLASAGSRTPAPSNRGLVGAALNEILPADCKLNSNTLPKIKMPNRDRFIPEPEFRKMSMGSWRMD